MKAQNRHTAQLFRHVRATGNMSVRGLATKLEIPQSTLSRIECGLLTPTPVAVERLVAISDADSLQALFTEAYR